MHNCGYALTDSMTIASHCYRGQKRKAIKKHNKCVCVCEREREREVITSCVCDCVFVNFGFHF